MKIQCSQMFLPSNMFSLLHIIFCVEYHHILPVPIFNHFPNSSKTAFSIS